MIELVCDKNRAFFRETEKLTSGSIGLTINFVFSPEWDGLLKTAVFDAGEAKIDVVLTSESCEVPPEVLACPGKQLFVGVFGELADKTLAIPTIYASAGTIRPGASPSGISSAPPTPSWPEQVQAIALEAKEAADSVRSDAEAGKFAGPAGEAGGFYTPAVTQPDANTIRMSFTPSKEDMPDVEPKDIILPSGGSGSVAVDSTLTASGKAADAKATGDAIRSLSEEIASITGVPLVEPEGDDIPKVYFTGTLPTSKAEDDVKLTMHYISKTADFIYPVTLKVQGSSSANYAKKNFTLKLYKDATYGSKKKLAFKNWPEMNKFVLKAHWIDHSHVRNVGTAKLWGKVVASRSDYNSLPEELRNSPNNGATDGFTVKVFANGVYQGLYEWIVPKDKLFGQDSNIVTHSILNSELNNQPTCAFATTSPTISGNWSEELQDTMSTAISTSFANLIKFVAGSTDEEFVENAENYFDVQSVIDFDIFARVFCIVDNLCRNQIFFTYDGVKWYEGVWDLDSILGLPPTTRGFFAYNTEFQTGYIAYKDYGVTNLLYQRVETLFMDRFKARYAELRSSVLSIENILDVYERLTDVITTYDGLLAEDYASTTGGGAFTGIPYKTENTIQQIRNFVSQRIPYMDEVVEAMIQTVPCTGISLNTDTLTFTSEGSQTLIATVTPDGCTDVVTWESNNASVATVNGGVVTAAANGNATITARCGDYSATCAVSVSGIAEPVACTGITLDSTELTFTGIGISKTLTATVTPSDTTDSILWTSDSIGVATVDNGVVTTVGIGNCEITATCGNHSASCSVSVSESVVANSFEESSWTEGYYNPDTGAVEAYSNMHHTQLIPISTLADEHRYAIVRPDATVRENLRISYFDSDYKHIGYDMGNGLDVYNKSPVEIVLMESAPDNAMYFVVNASTAVKSLITIVTGSIPEGLNLMDGVGWHYGSVNGNTGATISGTTNIITDAFDISNYVGTTFVCRVTGATGINSVKLAYFDADSKFISADYASADQSWIRATIPSNAATAKAGMLSNATAYEIAIGSVVFGASTVGTIT